jgi:uncharacterized protein
MAKQHFFFKLIPPRATFPHDITDAERALMAAHSDYCQREFDHGKLLVYGPVMSPEGAFGMGIVEVADEAEARQFGANDPSVLGGLNRFEVYPMRVPNARAKS